MLQGLIPRLTQLARLGGSFFLAFLPAVLVISLLFSGIYFVSFLTNCVLRSALTPTMLHMAHRVPHLLYPGRYIHAPYSQHYPHVCMLGLQRQLCIVMVECALQVYGQDFVHGGDVKRSSPPPYVDPFDLLDAPTVDPMVPLRR